MRFQYDTCGLDYESANHNGRRDHILVLCWESDVKLSQCNNTCMCEVIDMERLRNSTKCPVV